MQPVTEIDLYGDGIGKVQLVQHMGTDLTVVNAARVSFGVEKEALDDKDRKLIEYLIKNKHTSTLEHNVVTFKFTVPIFVARQHMRHRTWSFNEISRRYTSDNIRFFKFPTIKEQHESNRQASGGSLDDDSLAKYIMDKSTQDSFAAYNSLLENGVSREQARAVLPTNLYTEYYGTVNLNNLIKFIDLRKHAHAQKEIQDVANACSDIANELWPYTMHAFVIRNIK